MAAPKSVIWPIEPHTRAKHAILRGYLEAWFPILASNQGRIVYYDGFAGPGRYEGGEVGSPLIAINAARGHGDRLRSEVVFTFVEEDLDRAQWLKDVELEALRADLPDNFKLQVRHERFEDALRSTLDDLDGRGLQIAPTFAFIDPFGVRGLPFQLIRRLLKSPSCEVLVTFMTRDINRFVSEMPEHVAALIGNPDAPKLIAAAVDGALEARRLYEQSLRTVARFVRSFRMTDVNNNLIYDLFFATNSQLGHVRMKEAMWKVDGFGAFSFSDGLDPEQTVMFSPTPGADLAPLLWEHFRGRQVDSAEIVVYVENETAYVAKHARAALTLLESGEAPRGRLIEVNPTKIDGKRRRARTFPDGVIVHFVDP